MARLACAAFAAVVLGTLGVEFSTSDNADLVQGWLRARVANDDLTVPANGSNASNATPAPTPAPYVPIYRLTFKETWGDDHVCLAELAFYDALSASIPAEFLEASSCWGCAVSCGNCSVDYGNPLVLFDGVSDVDSAQAYFCTGFNSFDGNGLDGASSITFKLNQRPNTFSLLRPDAKGSAIAKAFMLEEIQPDGSWSVIRNAADIEKGLVQTVDVEFQAGPAGRWWEYENPNCLSDMRLPDSSSEPLGIEYLTIPAEDGRWQNNGKGIVFDGSIGSLTLNDETYYAKHLHFDFPSRRQLGVEGFKWSATGEIHIAFQKSDPEANEHEQGSKGLAIVVIPLRLPLERAYAPADTETWFEQMGLVNLPGEGAMIETPLNFSLNVFDKQLGGTYRDITICQVREDGSVDADVPRWFLTDKPAFVSGKVVQAFKDMFPYEAVSIDGSFNRTYLVDGKVQVIGYDQLGRKHLVGTSQPNDWDANIPDLAPSDAEWNANPNYVEGFGEYMVMGEWEIPEVVDHKPHPDQA